MKIQLIEGQIIILLCIILWRVVGGRLDERSINRRCHGTIAFGH